MNSTRLLLEALLSEDYSLATHLVLTGADPNLLLPEGAAPIHLAAGLDSLPADIIRLLLRHGADPNLRSCDGETPLHVSATYGRWEVLRLMLLNGADPEITNQDGQTAADLARQTGCEKCILTLEHFSQHPDLGDEEADDHTAFSIEPYEPGLLPVFSPTSLSGTSEEPCGTSLDSTCTSISDSSSHTSHSEFAGDTYIDCEERSGDSMSSYPSFHTCPSDNNITGPPQTEVKRAPMEKLTANVRETASGTHIPPATATSRYVPKLPSCGSLSHVPVMKSPSPAPSSVAPWRRFVDVFSGPSSIPPAHAHALHPPSDGGAQSLSAQLQVGNFGPCDGDAAEPNDGRSRLKYFATSGKTCENEKRKAIGNHVKRSRFDDESVSSCGSAAFMPTDYDPTDLSLHLGDQGDLSTQLEQLSLATCQIGRLNEQPIGSCKAHKRWLDHLRKFDQTSALSVEEVYGDHHQPKTSSRNCSAMTSDLDNLSQSTINDIKHSWAGNNPVHQPLGSGSVAQPAPSGHSCPSYNNPRRQKIRSPNSVTNCQYEVCSSAHHPGSCVYNKSCSAAKCSVPVHRCSSGSSGTQSSSSSVGMIQYLYTDDEDGYSLVETWFPITPPSPEVTEDLSVRTAQETLEDINAGTFGDTADYEFDAKSGSYKYKQKHLDRTDFGVTAEASTSVSLDVDIKQLSDADLRASLMTQGFTPGPITTATRALYKLKLMRYRQNPVLSKPSAAYACFPELGKLLDGTLETTLLQVLEDEMSRPFHDIDLSRKWREGNRKFSFNYLLLDPRITDNLPARTKSIGDTAAFRDFINSIFYIGKGKRARPYAHFKEAIQHQNQARAVGAKLQKILEIWEDGHGVISLHVFQNVIPVEAYTREAAMIEAIGRQSLTNIKAGEYYGPAAMWPLRQRRALGTRLLHKTFRIFLSEGERHIRPVDLQGS